MAIQQKAPSQMFERVLNTSLTIVTHTKAFIYILYILNKTTLTTENKSAVLRDLFLLCISTFNELVIKNHPVKKATPFFIFIEEVHLPHDQVFVLEDRTFHRKVLSKLYRNSKFNILGNLIFVLSTSVW